MVTRRNITARVRQAAHHGKVIFTQHAWQRMQQRGVTPSQVMRVLVDGEQVRTEAPNKPDQNPQTRLKRRTAGDNVVVVASVQELLDGEFAVVITAWN